jgi:hypothetical protein
VAVNQGRFVVALGGGLERCFLDGLSLKISLAKSEIRSSKSTMGRDGIESEGLRLHTGGGNVRLEEFVGNGLY